MFDTFDKFIRGISKAVLAVIMVIGFVMLVVAWAHIFYRYALNNSLTWSEELLKILLVWFCLLSATFISVRREHVKIVIFKQLLPKVLENKVDLFVSFLMFFGSAAMCYIGWRLAGNAGMRRSPALRIPFSHMYAAIYVSFFIMALYELRNFLADILAPGRPAALSDPIEDMAAPDLKSLDIDVQAGQPQ